MNERNSKYVEADQYSQLWTIPTIQQFQDSLNDLYQITQSFGKLSTGNSGFTQAVTAGPMVAFGGFGSALYSGTLLAAEYPIGNPFGLYVPNQYLGAMYEVDFVCSFTVNFTGTIVWSLVNGGTDKTIGFILNEARLSVTTGVTYDVALHTYHTPDMANACTFPALRTSVNGTVSSSTLWWNPVFTMRQQTMTPRVGPPPGP